MDEISYNGSHGTSLTRYTEICKSGFKLGSGLAGKGVYFWVESPLYIELAEAWFKQEKQKGKYELNSKCAIIIASLHALSAEHIDFDNRKFQEQIYLLSRKKNFNNSRAAKEQAYNLFISMLEEKLGIIIKMITIRLPAPESFAKTYPFGYLGTPVCCVVRCLTSIVSHKLHS